MNTLIWATDRCYYIHGQENIGIVLLDDIHVMLISDNCTTPSEEVKEILSKRGWVSQGILLNRNECQEHVPGINTIFQWETGGYELQVFSTDEGIVFLGESTCAQDLLSVRHMLGIVDPCEYLKLQDALYTLAGNLFIPSRGLATDNLKNLVNLNKHWIQSTATIVKKYVSKHQGDLPQATLDLARIYDIHDENLLQVVQNYALLHIETMSSIQE